MVVVVVVVVVVLVVAAAAAALGCVCVNPNFPDHFTWLQLWCVYGAFKIVIWWIKAQGNGKQYISPLNLLLPFRVLVWGTCSKGKNEVMEKRICYRHVKNEATGLKCLVLNITERQCQFLVILQTSSDIFHFWTKKIKNTLFRQRSVTNEVTNKKNHKFMTFDFDTHWMQQQGLNGI
jgi:hypothetical protein